LRRSTSSSWYFGKSPAWNWTWRHHDPSECRELPRPTTRSSSPRKQDLQQQCCGNLKFRVIYYCCTKHILFCFMMYSCHILHMDHMINLQTPKLWLSDEFYFLSQSPTWCTNSLFLIICVYYSPVHVSSNIMLILRRSTV
jgi:hypothetical protein